MLAILMEHRVMEHRKITSLGHYEVINREICE